MSIIAYPLEATEYTAEDVQGYLSTRTSGVYSEDITFTPEGMTVTVSPFLAWFNYAKFKGCSVAVTEPETLTFSPAHAVLHRADRIVLRLDFTVNKAYFTILEGTPSSYPVSVPRISRSEAVYDLCLATVFITAGSTEILESDITSELLNDKVCGIMRDGVTGIPTAQLQEQVEALLIRLHDAITEVQSGSAFMIGDVYDPTNKAKPVAFSDEVLPLGGGKLTGSYFGLYDGYSWLFGNAVQTRIDSCNTKENAATAPDFRSLQVVNSSYRPDIAKAFCAIDSTTDNSGKKTQKTYNIFGEHNKPTGSYTGNGATRSINIGGVGSCVYIYALDGTIQAFATDKTGFGWEFVSNSSATDVEIVNTDVSYTDGYLYIDGSNDSLNTSGVTYYYQVL